MKKILCIYSLIVLCALPVQAQFRKFIPINTPGVIPEGAVPVDQWQSIDRKVIELGVRDVMQSWNGQGLGQKLAEEFYDAQRLEDAISTSAPRNAKVRVMAVQGQQLLQQYLIENKRISHVSVTVKTQVEYEDAQNGFQVRPGTQELVLRVTEDAS